MFADRRTTMGLAILFISDLALFPVRSTGQTVPPVSIDAHTRTAVVEEIGELLIEKYVYLETAEKMKEHLQKKLRHGDYDDIDDAASFSMALVDDLYQISQDRHFHIEFNPERAELIRAQRSQSKEQNVAAERQYCEDAKRANFGFKKLEHLKGNVGYLDLRSFSNAEYAGQTAVAAMNFLANSDAVIIDLRNNSGGYPNMVQFLCSYFVKGIQEGRTHLNTLVRRFDDSSEQFWTVAYVPGKRMYDTELYVVTSQYTGSGAEEFVYNLKNLERATLVGETTAGAGHHVEDVVIQDNFVMYLPTGRPVNPISGTGWEKTGVEPDVAVEAAKAFDTAYTMALENILQKGTDEERLLEINWALDGPRARLEPVELDEATLRKYAGVYGERKVWLEDDGALHYQRSGPRYRLFPLSERLFALEGLDRFRIEFLLDENGRATELVGHYDDGTTDLSLRTE